MRGLVPVAAIRSHWAIVCLKHTWVCCATLRYVKLPKKAALFEPYILTENPANGWTHSLPRFDPTVMSVVPAGTWSESVRPVSRLPTLQFSTYFPSGAYPSTDKDDEHGICWCWWCWASSLWQWWPAAAERTDSLRTNRPASCNPNRTDLSHIVGFDALTHGHTTRWEWKCIMEVHQPFW